MRVIREVPDLSKGEGGVPGALGTVVTIGAFDGVHRGHRRVLRLVRELADARGLDAGLVTFDRHPAQVVRPESAPKLLTTLEQRLQLLDETKLLDLCLVLHFDEQRAMESAEDFVRDVLVDRLAARVVVVGADFHFGHQRAGNVALLDQMGSRLGADSGFEVIGLGLVAPDDDPTHEPFSSTRVRAALVGGDVEAAQRLLGREHAVAGEVQHGTKRGRELGFPTANVAVADEICLPADGIYAGTVVLPNGDVRMSAISIGRRPTFFADQGYSLLEAHLLDFEGDLYDQIIEVRFSHRIRGEQRFESVEALVDQITHDVTETRNLLNRNQG